MAIYGLDGVDVEWPQDDCYIAPTASLIGKIRLHPGASIWFGAVLRGDNELIEIGSNSNIQDGCVCHTDIGYPMILGDYCTVGHAAVLHGCTIGRNCLIGIGAILLNGSKIGNNCIVGAGALVTEGKEIPDNSLVIGAPGRVLRQVTQEEIQTIATSAIHYADNGKRYKNGLTSHAECP
jgi:carbonic anhydrase/acetyltransferase-like protein (isoleucine patch superfamily)